MTAFYKYVAWPESLQLPGNSDDVVDGGNFRSVNTCILK